MSYYASYYKVPQFPEMSTDSALTNKKTHATVVRVGPSYSKFGAAMKTLMEKYGWAKAAFLYYPGSSLCRYGVEAIQHMFVESNFTVLEFIQMQRVSSEKIIANYLTRVRSRARGIYEKIYRRVSI